MDPSNTETDSIAAEKEFELQRKCDKNADDFE